MKKYLSLILVIPFFSFAQENLTYANYINNTDIYIIPNTIHRDENRSINDKIYSLTDNTRMQKNIKCIQKKYR